MCNAKNSWLVLWVADLLCKQRVWHDMKITISYILFTKGNLIKKGSYDLYHDCHACIGAKGLYINLMHFTYLECKLQVQCHASGSLLKRQFQTPTILWWNSQQFFMFFFSRSENMWIGKILSQNFENVYRFWNFSKIHTENNFYALFFNSLFYWTVLIEIYLPGLI